jgi:hypothetical protein
MKITRAVLFIAVLGATLLRANGPALAQAAIDTAAWRDDFAQLRQAMDEHYANLEWVAKVRRTDLAALLAKTNAAIDSATSVSAAQKAIADFLSAMGDGHLEIDWPEPPGTATTPPGSLCARLGYRERRLSPGLQFQLLASTSPVAGSMDRYFPVQSLNLADGNRIGILRIGIFSAQWYPELCTAALEQLHLSEHAACNDACADRVQIAAENELTSKLSAAILALKGTPSLRAVAVDLTGNGGGSDWEEPAARELTAAPLNSPRVGFVKHDHWQNSSKTTSLRFAPIFPRRQEAIGSFFFMQSARIPTYWLFRSSTAISPLSGSTSPLTARSWARATSIRQARCHTRVRTRCRASTRRNTSSIRASIPIKRACTTGRFTSSSTVTRRQRRNDSPPCFRMQRLLGLSEFRRMERDVALRTAVFRRNCTIAKRR